MKIAICSVSYKQADYLNLNLNLTISKNPEIQFEWYVPVNYVSDSDLLDDRFIQLPGTRRPKNKPEGRAGFTSYHHAATLNRSMPILKESNADYYCILDPDFYITKSWLDIVLHMDKKGLDFFGAPYWPLAQPLRPVMDFPTAFCMFINPKIDILSFDFTPGNDDPRYTDRRWKHKPSYSRKKRKDALCRFPDTGYKVYEKYREMGRYEIVDFVEKNPWHDVLEWRGSHFAWHFHTNHSRTKHLPGIVGHSINNRNLRIEELGGIKFSIARDLLLPKKRFQ